MLKQSRFSYLTYPALMTGFMWLSWWCYQQALDPKLRDWQSINDAGHGVLTGLLRPVPTEVIVLRTQIHPPLPVEPGQ